MSNKHILCNSEYMKKTFKIWKCGWTCKIEKNSIKSKISCIWEKTLILSDCCT